MTSKTITLNLGRKIVQFGAFLALLICISTPAEISLAAASEPGEAFFQRVLELKRKHKIRKVQDLLPLLPKSFRSNHVLMFESRSLQQAGFLAPRVILFTPTADFVMTFNGNSSQEGFESIETVRFNHTQKRFIFEEIVFEDDLTSRLSFLRLGLNASKDNQERDFQARLIEQIGDRSMRSGPNPKACLGCHQQDPRPNWEHYKFWPGAFGQADNMMGTEKIRVRDPISGEKIGLDNSVPAKSLKTFVNDISAAHPRYGKLENLQSYLLSDDDYPVEPYPYDLQRASNHNIFYFTDAVMRLNYKRIFRLMRRSPKYERIKWAIPYWTGACGYVDFEDRELNLSTESNLRFLARQLNVSTNFLSTNFAQGAGNSLNAPTGYDGPLSYELAISDRQIAPMFNFDTYLSDSRYAPIGIVNKSMIDCDLIVNSLKGFRSEK